MTLIDEIKRNRASNPIYGGRLADALLAVWNNCQGTLRAPTISAEHQGEKDFAEEIMEVINDFSEKSHDRK
jgi:hypothetical protein